MRGKDFTEKDIKNLIKDNDIENIFKGKYLMFTNAGNTKGRHNTIIVNDSRDMVKLIRTVFELVDSIIYGEWKVESSRSGYLSFQSEDEDTHYYLADWSSGTLIS